MQKSIVALAVAGVLAAYFLVLNDPDWFFSLVPGDLAGGRTPHASVETLRDVLYHPPEASSMLSVFAAMLFTHNSQVALFAFALVPPDVAAGHFFVDAMLPRSNHLREERQRLAFEALLALEGGTFARCVAIGFGLGPRAETHQSPSPRAARAAVERIRMAAVMLPV